MIVVGLLVLGRGFRLRPASRQLLTGSRQPARSGAAAIMPGRRG